MKKILLLFTLLNMQLFADIWVVDSTGNGDFIDIQSAIYSASDGDTVFVKNGTYKAFLVFDKEITIIGESKNNTKISDEYTPYISTIKKCEIRNLHFTGNELQGGFWVDSYARYKDTGIIPELIIENCVFDYTPPLNIKEDAITIVIIYEDMMYGDALDTLSRRLHIHNNNFIDMKRAITIYHGGITGILKKNNDDDNLKKLLIDCRDNYFGLFDSSAIGELVLDDRDELPFNYVNVTHFNYMPWLDTIITRVYNIQTPGMRFNNFINNDVAFLGGLSFDTTSTRIYYKNQIPESFKITKVYPNPFNSKVKIEFQVEKYGQVEFKCFDNLGREINRLLVRKMFSVGLHTYTLDFLDLPSGIYFITLKNERRTYAFKTLLIK